MAGNGSCSKRFAGHKYRNELRVAGCSEITPSPARRGSAQYDQGSECQDTRRSSFRNSTRGAHGTRRDVNQYWGRYVRM